MPQIPDPYPPIDARGGRERSPGSPHFIEQAGRYASGNRRSVYFSPGEITGHIERSYIPSV